jgi:hypothetical protein
VKVISSSNLLDLLLLIFKAKYTQRKRQSLPCLGLGVNFNLTGFAKKDRGKVYRFGCKNYFLGGSIAV